MIKEGKKEVCLELQSSFRSKGALNWSKTLFAVLHGLHMDGRKERRQGERRRGKGEMEGGGGGGGGQDRGRGWGHAYSADGLRKQGRCLAKMRPEKKLNKTQSLNEKPRKKKTDRCRSTTAQLSCIEAYDYIGAAYIG